MLAKGFNIPLKSFFVWYYDEYSERLMPLLLERGIENTMEMLFMGLEDMPVIVLDTLSSNFPFFKRVIKEGSSRVSLDYISRTNQEVLEDPTTY